jgi:hypothetical protein
MNQASVPLSRRLFAEGLGTAILLATVVGSGIMAERLAGGNQAIALLGNTIPTGAILVVIITTLGPVSGAHFNPAVTLVFAARGDTPWSDVGPYIVVQCLSAIAGTILAHLMFELAPLAIGTTARSGASQWLAEAVATFTLVLGHRRWTEICALGNSVACGAYDYRCVLVYRVHFLCQPGRHACPRVHNDLCGNCDQPCACIYCCAVAWSRARYSGFIRTLSTRAERSADGRGSWRVKPKTTANLLPFEYLISWFIVGIPALAGSMSARVVCWLLNRIRARGGA